MTTMRQQPASPRVQKPRRALMDEAKKTRRREVAGLAAALRKSKGPELRQLLDSATWEALSEVLIRRSTESRECLIHEGVENRSVYFLESGLVRVFRSEGNSRLQLAVLGAGAVLGEASFFAPRLRSASAEMLEPAPVWELTAEGYETLLRRSPLSALRLCRYLGAVLVSRMVSGTGRLLVT
jgi:CRP/FNR family transcriptional regulator, cyclic AMP receptor protein